MVEQPEKPGIILVEDDPVFATYAKKILKDQKFIVHHFSNPGEAIDHFKINNKIELVLMDYELGGPMDGVDTARKILEIRDVPIVFLTSHDEEGIVRKVNTVKSYGYVLKSSSPALILQSVAMAYNLFTAMKKVEESENRFRMMYENHPAVMIIVDSVTGKIREANHAAAAFYGYSREVLKSKNVREINIKTDEEIRRQMEKALTEEQNHFYFRHRLSSGEIRDVSVHSGPIREGGDLLLFSIVRDVTLEKRLEKKQARLQTRIELITRQLDELSELLLETGAYQYSMSTPSLRIAEKDSTIIHLIQKGLNNREIGDKMNVAEITVKKRLAALYKQFGVKNKYQLIEYLSSHYLL